MCRSVAYKSVALAGSAGPSAAGPAGWLLAVAAAAYAAADPSSVAGDGVAPISTPSHQQWQAQARRDINPENDGWDSEAFAEQAGKQLQRLAVALKRDESAQAGELALLAAPDFVCGPLRPDRLETVFSDNVTEVQRATPADDSQTAEHRGADGFARAINDLAAGLRSATHKVCKFKIFRIEAVGDRVDATCYLDVSGRTPRGAVQRTATWRVRWVRDAAEQPLIASIASLDFEEVRVRSDRQTLFVDATKRLLQATPDCHRQFYQGADEWRAKLEAYLGIYFDGLHGLAIADVNGDGLDDLYVCEPGGLPNRLLLQRTDGRLADASQESGLNLLDSTRNAVFVDFDNDGDQDFATAMERRLHIYENDGAGVFSPRLAIPIAGPTPYFVTSVDFDHNGFLDLYAGSYFGAGDDESNRLPAPLPLHDSRTGGRNVLVANWGGWKFTDVTEQTGLHHNNDRWSFAAVWEDYDNDGDQDLYVANDFGRNNLYRNDGGKFVDVAETAGAVDSNFGMSATFGDYNRDGWMDLYVSNMFSAAGGRITFQPDFQADGQKGLRSAYQRMARGNTLLQNLGNGTFKDVSERAGVTMGRWAWGSLFADINNDGWEDLLVANGFVTGHLPGDL